MKSLTETRHIIAIDPGLMTGMCAYTYTPGEEPVLIWSGEITEEEFAPTIRSFMEGAKQGGFTLEVVCERFTITKETAKKSQAPFSLELIGNLKQIMRDYGYPIPKSLHLQTPADAKNMFPNPKLKVLEQWHRGGAGHALDSIRHALLYLVRTGWKPTGLLS